MARNNRNSSGSKSGGSTWFGVLAGLIIGLAIATVVAVFVARAPMPFVDHASRDPAKTLLPDVKDAPDPNIGLSGNDGAAGVAPTGPINTAPAPLSGQASTAKGQTPLAADQSPTGDKLSKLIATLTDNSNSPAKPAASPPAASHTTPRDTVSEMKPAPTAKAAIAATKTPAPANTQTIYFLQAGAFHSNKEAEATKARILLMGLPVEVQKAQINGSTINRVRVGPFKGIDAMNRSRARLSEEKITSSVVRQ